MSLHRAQAVLSDYRTHHGVEKMTSLDEHHPWKMHMAEKLSSDVIIGRDTIVELYQFAASENKEAQLRDLDGRWTSMLVLSTPANTDLHKRNKILINDSDMASNEQRAAMEVNRLRSLGYDVEYVPYGDAYVHNDRLPVWHSERDEMQAAYDMLAQQLRLLRSELDSDRLDFNESHRVSKQERIPQLEAQLRDLQAELDRISRAIDEVEQAYVIQWRGSKKDTTKPKDDAKVIIPENDEEKKPAPGQRITSPRESGSEEPSYTFSPAERSMELIAVLSDSEQMHYQRIAREVETELQREYAQLSSYDMLGKLKFFYTRKQQRKERIEERMQNLHRQPFT